MKKIYINIISLMVAGIALTSCSDWLDVNPSDEIKEEYLFQTGDGYQTALNGIYRKMATFNLYGSNLTWGIIDAWGQAYSMIHPVLDRLCTRLPVSISATQS